MAKNSLTDDPGFTGDPSNPDHRRQYKSYETGFNHASSGKKSTANYFKDEGRKTNYEIGYNEGLPLRTNSKNSED